MLIDRFETIVNLPGDQLPEPNQSWHGPAMQRLTTLIAETEFCIQQRESTLNNIVTVDDADRTPDETLADVINIPAKRVDEVLKPESNGRFAILVKIDPANGKPLEYSWVDYKKRRGIGIVLT